MVGTVTGATFSGRLMAQMTHYKRTPLIGLTCAVAALLVLAVHPTGLPQWLVADSMRTDGPTMQVLRQVLQSRSSPAFVLAEVERPILQSDLEGQQYLEKAFSGSSRLSTCSQKFRVG